MEWEQIIHGCVEHGVATLRCLPAVFQNVVNAALLLAGVVALFLIFYGAFKFVYSRGDPKKFENARETIVYAIIGLIIVLFSLFAINLISYLTGVKCLTFFGFGNCQ